MRPWRERGRERQRERRKGDQTGKREARACDRGGRSTGNMRRRAHSRHSRENERARRAARSRIARTHVIAQALARNVPSDRYLANSLGTPSRTGVSCALLSIFSYPPSGMSLPLGCAVTWTIYSDDIFGREQSARLSGSDTCRSRRSRRSSE